MTVLFLPSKRNLTSFLPVISGCFFMNSSHFFFPSFPYSMPSPAVDLLFYRSTAHFLLHLIFVFDGASGFLSLTLVLFHPFPVLLTVSSILIGHQKLIICWKELRKHYVILEGTTSSWDVARKLLYINCTKCLKIHVKEMICFYCYSDSSDLWL